MAQSTNPFPLIMDGRFDDFVKALLEKHHIPGMSIAIVRGAEVESKVRKLPLPLSSEELCKVSMLTGQGFGFSRLSGTPATPDTLYFAGSTTKAFTAAAAGKIVQNKNGEYPALKWTTPMSEILAEDFVLDDDHATTLVTVEDALSHRSGLPLYDDSYGWGQTSAVDTVRSMRYLPLSASLRTQWQYNNSMYAAVQVVAERMTGSSLEEILKAWFWKPLGMDSTTLSLERARTMNDSAGQSLLARGYYWSSEEGRYIPDDYLDLTPVAGAGAMISSVKDLAAWIKALLAASKSAAASPIDHDLFQKLTRPRCIIPDFYASMWEHCTGPSTYALGWFVQHVGCTKLISHGGGLCGFGTTLYLVPEHDLGFVAMGNTMGTSNTVGEQIFRGLLKTLHIYQPANKSSVNTDDPAQGAQQVDNGQANISTQVLGEDLPGNLEDYLGVYSHPAFGELHVSLASPVVKQQTLKALHSQNPSLTTPENPLSLLIEPTKRTWPYSYVLTHKSAAEFNMAIFFTRGTGDESAFVENKASTSEGCLECERKVVLEFLYSARAALEPSGEGAAMKMGLQVSPELAGCEAAETNWRAGMVWFDNGR